MIRNNNHKAPHYALLSSFLLLSSSLISKHHPQHAALKNTLSLCSYLHVTDGRVWRPPLFHIMIDSETFRQCFPYDDRADCTCSVTDMVTVLTAPVPWLMMTVLTARVPWFIHTNRSICIYVYRNLFSLFRAISALSFKRINFILEEDNISSLYLHDLECSISNARDSLEHSWWYTAMSREQHVYVARTNDIKFNVDTI